MADTSLDDFFAKKDKKKKTGKKLKNSDPDDVKEKKKEKKKDKDKLNSGLSNSQKQKDDEEWNDFEEEKETDYTGLKIQNMQIAKEAADKEAAEKEEEGEEEDGEGGGQRRGQTGPWANADTPQPAPAPKPAPEEIKPKEEPVVPKVPGKYVPPGARQSATPTLNPVMGRRNRKEAPNMQSEEDFPSLAGGPAPCHRGAVSGDIMDSTAQRKGANLTLENKFSALQD